MVIDPTIDLAIQPNSDARPSIALASSPETFALSVNPKPLKFQVTTGNEGFDVKRINDLDSQSLGVYKIDVVGEDKAGRAVTITQDAINKISRERSSLGAFENEFTRTMSRLDSIKLNTEQAESQIRDTDMAQEMINFTMSQLLTETSASMITQANMMPNAIWDLLFKG